MQLCSHPGAQLDAFEERDGHRYTAHATDTTGGQLAHLDDRHRTHARIERAASAAVKTPAWAAIPAAALRSTTPG
jgi:hypothetical protein